MAKRFGALSKGAARYRREARPVVVGGTMCSYDYLAPVGRLNRSLRRLRDFCFVGRGEIVQKMMLFVLAGSTTRAFAKLSRKYWKRLPYVFGKCSART